MTTLCESMVVKDGGCHPARVVLRYEKGAVQPFVTHIEVFPSSEGRPPYYWAGHYTDSFEKAVTDFGIRAQALIREAVIRNAPARAAR